jgi:uncharacterized protein (DUF2147 family)
MKNIRLSIFAAALALAPIAADAASVMGEWLAPAGDAKARLAPCGAGVCGTIVWLKRPTDPASGKPVTDTHNPDPAQRARPVVGMRFLSGFRPDGDNRWTGGRIYDPKSGKTYDSKLSLDGKGDLKLQGCVGPFCQAQIWTPAG